MNIQNGARQILLHGLMLVMAGLLWGLVVPHTPWPRLALGAHIQFVTNGVLLAVMATLLLALPHRVGSRSLLVMVLTAWLTWVMAGSEVLNAWWGTRQMLPLAAAQAGATGGAPWQEQLVTLAHVFAGLGLIVSWALLLRGFWRAPAQRGPVHD